MIVNLQASKFNKQELANTEKYEEGIALNYIRH